MVKSELFNAGKGKFDSLLRSHSLVRRIGLAEKNLGLRNLKETGIRSEQLVIQRLGKQVADQNLEKENLLKKLTDAETKNSDLANEINKLKKEAEEQVFFLKEKIDEIQTLHKVKEEELAKWKVQMEELSASAIESQKRSKEEIEKAIQRTDIYAEIQSKLSAAIALLEDGLNRGEEKMPVLSAGVCGASFKAIADLGSEFVETESSSMPIMDTDSSHVSPEMENLVPEPEDAGFFKRFTQWWQEPVTTISLFPFKKV